jgi:hypothetical protein
MRSHSRFLLSFLSFLAAIPSIQAQPGSLDENFNPGFELPVVFAMALQEDGRILVGGIVRLNDEGSPDPTFNPGNAVEADVRLIRLQRDGKVLIGGLFTQIDGELRNPIGENHAILLRTNIDYRKFDDESDADHLEAGGLLGLESQLPLGFDLDLAGGAGYLDTEGGSNQPHVVGYGNLVWRNAPSGLQVRLGFHHEMTQDLAGNDFMDTTGRVSIEKYFGLQTSATVTGFVSQFDNDSVNPSDNLYGGAEVVLRRQISRNFQVSLAYRYWDNAGDFDLDDFQQNQASIAITYRH